MCKVVHPTAAHRHNFNTPPTLTTPSHPPMTNHKSERTQANEIAEGTPLTAHPSDQSGAIERQTEQPAANTTVFPPTQLAGAASQRSGSPCKPDQK